jgi:hypothetical protein
VSWRSDAPRAAGADTAVDAMEQAKDLKATGSALVEGALTARAGVYVLHVVDMGDKSFAIRIRHLRHGQSEDSS